MRRLDRKLEDLRNAYELLKTTRKFWLKARVEANTEAERGRIEKALNESNQEIDRIHREIGRLEVCRSHGTLGPLLLGLSSLVDPSGVKRYPIDYIWFLKLVIYGKGQWATKISLNSFLITALIGLLPILLYGTQWISGQQLVQICAIMALGLIIYFALAFLSVTTLARSEKLESQRDRLRAFENTRRRREETAILREELGTSAESAHYYYDDFCVKCGCSKEAIEYFHWKCKGDLLRSNPRDKVEQNLNQALEKEASARRGNISSHHGIKIFISYSHKDIWLREQLSNHLKVLERQGLITAWHDRKIDAGSNWRDTIDSSVESADLILLLVSSDFLASDYCFDIEMTSAISRHDQGKSVVIPIIARDCDWQEAPFGKLQALPTGSRPITQWTDRDEALKDVVIGIKRAARARLQSKVDSSRGKPSS